MSNSETTPAGNDGMRKRQPYSKPALTEFGSLRNLTGGSCGFNIDGIFGNSNPGNPFGIGMNC